MSMITPLFAVPHRVDASDAAGQRAFPSLPPAGFRVSRVCDLRCAIGMFTPHRADPSWT